MKPWLIALLVLAPALAGCASQDEGPAMAAVQTGILQGTVTTTALEPLNAALVRIPDTNYEARTDATGKFVFELPLGEYLVITQVDGYINSAQRARIDGAPVTLDFRLNLKPTQAAGVRSFEAHGLFTCGATIKTGDGHSGGERQTYNCGSNDPNNRQTLDFIIDPEPGITGVIIEMVWTPTTQAGRAFQLQAFQVQSAAEEEIGDTEGLDYVKIVIPESVAKFRFASGGILRTLSTPAGSFLDEESPADVGVAFEQPFTIYVTVFTNAPAPDGFSVIR